MFFYVFFTFVILQRISELIIAKRNYKLAINSGGIEYDKSGYKFIVIMHIMFFISLIVEYHFFSRLIFQFWYIFFIVFIIAQILRYWSIVTLGKYWNTKIIVIPNSKLIIKGPYKFIKHPNYLAVVLEIASLPIIFSCFITSMIFSLINFILIRRRISIEESALSQLS
jgi:methyltransferase